MRIRTEREDGVIVSTVRLRCFAWYGNYETAVSIDKMPWKILEGYDTEEQAVKGHEKYENMSKEDLENLDCIG